MIIFNLESKRQKIIPCTEGAQGIAALCLSASKRYLAISERTHEEGLIKVIDFRSNSLSTELKPKKILFHPELQNSFFSQMAFFLKEEHKFLVAVTNKCDVVIFEWDKAKIKSCLKVSSLNKPRGLFFNPLEKTTLLLYGLSANKKPPFKLMTSKVENGNVTMTLRNDLFKDFLKNYETHILSHVVLKDSHYSLLFGTLEGELLLVNKQYELKIKLTSSPFNHFKIEKILPVENGFAIAGSSSNILFYEKNNKDLKNPFSRVDKKVELQKYSFNSVNNFARLNSETFIIGLSSGELLQATLLSNKNGMGSHFKVDNCIQHFHNNQINDVQMCERKDIFVFASQDKFLTVFNYKGIFGFFDFQFLRIDLKK